MCTRVLARCICILWHNTCSKEIVTPNEPHTHMSKRIGTVDWPHAHTHTHTHTHTHSLTHSQVKVHWHCELQTLGDHDRGEASTKGFAAAGDACTARRGHNLPSLQCHLIGVKVPRDHPSRCAIPTTGRISVFPTLGLLRTGSGVMAAAYTHAVARHDLSCKWRRVVPALDAQENQMQISHP
jgi:hypothetical protein